MKIPDPPRTFGVEEEYQLLDAGTGSPVNCAAELVLALPGFLRQSSNREYLASQIETATPICRDAETAEEALVDFRSTVSSTAETFGVVLAGSGLPPAGGDALATVTPKPRYLLIQSEMRTAVQHQYATGVHVHVEVPTRDIGIAVIARLSRWAPVLLALTANSPLWCGAASGFASRRHIMSPNWPVSGYPVDFSDAAEYDRAVEALIGTGVVPDEGMLSWAIRLSARYPTVELRIADSQLAAADTVAFATIVRALVERAAAEEAQGIDRPRILPGLVGGANWLAARDGLSSRLVDPLLAESMPAFDLVDRMLRTIRDELERFGDLPRVESYLLELRRGGGPAQLQQAAFEASGIPGVLELYRAGGR